MYLDLSFDVATSPGFFDFLVLPSMMDKDKSEDPSGDVGDPSGYSGGVSGYSGVVHSLLWLAASLLLLLLGVVMYIRV